MRWPRLRPEFLDLEMAALSFFTAEAFRYFLPAYLLCVVAGEPLNANPVFHLVYGLTPEYKDKRDDAVEQFSPFSLEERTVIVAFLAACVQLADDNDKRDITAALDSYWLPSLAPSGGAG